MSLATDRYWLISRNGSDLMWNLIQSFPDEQTAYVALREHFCGQTNGYEAVIIVVCDT